MSQMLQVEVSDVAFQSLRQRADSARVTPERLAATTLETEFATRPIAQEGPQGARERFESHFGAVDLGRPTGVCNDDIDADLAREYAASHEEQ